MQPTLPDFFLIGRECTQQLAGVTGRDDDGGVSAVAGQLPPPLSL